MNGSLALRVYRSERKQNYDNFTPVTQSAIQITYEYDTADSFCDPLSL